MLVMKVNLQNKGVEACIGQHPYFVSLTSLLAYFLYGFVSTGGTLKLLSVCVLVLRCKRNYIGSHWSLVYISHRIYFAWQREFCNKTRPNMTSPAVSPRAAHGKDVGRRGIRGVPSHLYHP